MKTRALALFAAAAVAALVLAPGAAGAGGARRSGGRHPATASLTRPHGAPDANASGAIRIRAGHGGDRLLVRLRGLNPRRGYDLRDAGSGSALGRVVTNRRGSGSIRLRNATDLAGATLEVVDEDTGDTVLDGQAPDPSVTHDAVREAELVMEGTGVRAVLDLRSDQTSGSERMVLEAGLPADGSFDLFMDDGTGVMTDVGTLTLGSGDGNHGLFHHSAHHSANHVRDHGTDTGSGDSNTGSGDANGDTGDTGDTGSGDTDGDNEDSGDDDDNGGTDTTGVAVFSWSVDTADGTKLPFEAATLDDLAGRAIEIRDADGNAVLSGEVPVLTDSQDEDGTDDGNDNGGDTGDHQDTGDNQDTGDHQDGGDNTTTR